MTSISGSGLRLHLPILSPAGLKLLRSSPLLFLLVSPSPAPLDTGLFLLGHPHGNQATNLRRRHKTCSFRGTQEHLPPGATGRAGLDAQPRAAAATVTHKFRHTQNESHRDIQMRPRANICSPSEANLSFNNVQTWLVGFLSFFFCLSN